MRRYWKAGAAVLMLLLAACDEPPAAPDAADPVGALRVTNTASGPLQPGPDYVQLQLSAGRVVMLPFNDAVIVDSLPAGTVTLAVAALARVRLDCRHGGLLPPSSATAARTIIAAIRR